MGGGRASGLLSQGGQHLLRGPIVVDDAHQADVWQDALNHLDGPAVAPALRCPHCFRHPCQACCECLQTTHMGLHWSNLGCLQTLYMHLIVL